MRCDKALFRIILAMALGAALMGQVCVPPSTTPDDGTDGTGGDGNGGATDGGDGGTTDGGGGTTLNIVKTDIGVRHDAALKCGDDLIAFGTGTATSSTVGVSYIIPSTAPTAGTAVPSTELYNAKSLAVGGRTIFLVGAVTGSQAYQVTTLNVDTAAATTLPTTDVRLGRIPAAASDAGHLQADGDYCVVVCDPSSVTDGKVLKVIDVSGGTPVATSFATNPASSAFGVAQVAVDAATGTAVAVADDTFYVYDISNPATAPTQIAAPNGVGDAQIQISGDTIISLDDQSYPEAFLVDLGTSSVVNLTNALASNAVAIGGDTFAFFADADASDRGERAAVGTVPGPGFTKAPLDQYIDGYTVNNGLVGFGGSMCVTPDGSQIFLGDSALQYSPGTASFTAPPDAGGTDPYVTPAWDIDCSANTVGFKTATTRTGGAADKIGYIILP